MGKSSIKCLQTLSDPVRLRLVMWIADPKRNDSATSSEAVVCKGVMVFPLPIVNNFPGLKMNNLACRKVLR
jgi:hypothetical protein